MRTLALAEENSKFEAVEGLIGTNGAFCLVEKKEKEREGRRRELQAGCARRT
jgi:hypothetical protein